MNGYDFSTLAIAALLMTVFTAGTAFAKGASQQSGSPSVTFGATKGATHAVSGSTVNVFQLPKETAKSASAANSKTNQPQIPVRSSPKLGSEKALGRPDKRATRQVADEEGEALPDEKPRNAPLTAGRHQRPLAVRWARANYASSVWHALRNVSF